MSQIRLLLADKDVLFLDKFSAYLQRNKPTLFSLELATSASKLDEWLLRGGKADLIAISSALFSQLQKKPENAHVIILSDSSQSILPADFPCISKYKPAELLMKEILSLCAEKLPDHLHRPMNLGKLELVLYADGSDALNPFAQTLALVKAQNGERVFYLNLDDFSNSDTYFTSSNPKGLSEMLYYVKSQKENLALKLEACCSKDPEYGIDFMKGHKNAEDIGKLTAEELKSLIGAISGNAYDGVVISKAFRYDEILSMLLKEAHRVYVTALCCRSSLIRLSKISDLFSTLEEEKALKLQGKVKFCMTAPDKSPICQNVNFKYPAVYLPLLIDAGVDFFPPQGPYVSAVKTMAE